MSVVELHDAKVSEVADRYREDGYRVTVGPEPSDLPEFLNGLSPDLVAIKGDENVIVEVESRDSLRRPDRDTRLEYWIGKVNSQPGWRFDLVVFNTSAWPDRIAGDARELDESEIGERVKLVLSLINDGAIEPACLYAWSLIEAAMRIVAGRFGIHLDNKTPQFIAKTLIAEGVISRSDYDLINSYLKMRNAVAHGLKPAGLDRDLAIDMASMIERLLIISGTANPSVSA